jgi:sugar lactone lactonase YvrE
MRTLKVLIDGLAFPEGPRWRDGKLFFSDMHAHQVLAVDMAGKREVICEVPARPSGLGWLPDFAGNPRAPATPATPCPISPKR